DAVRSLGADHVVDYTQEDFTQSGQRYDLMLDIAGNRSWEECTRVLAPRAAFVLIGGSAHTGYGAGGTLRHLAGVRPPSVRGGRRMVFFIARLDKADLAVLGDLLEAGRMTPVVDRRYALSETRDALRYLGEGHARGKVVVTV